MALKTTLQQLESVQAAIDAIEGGAQSVTYEGKKIDRGQLETLYSREERLLSRYKSEQGTGGTPAFNVGQKVRY